MTSLDRVLEISKKFIPPKGLSEEEKKEFKARLQEEYRIINEERNRPYQFDFIARFEELGIRREDLPKFMYGILKMQCMLKTQAEIFIDEFCIPYLEDEGFKEYCFGKFIFVEDGYFDILDNLSGIDFNSNTEKAFVKIGPLRTVNGFGKSINKLRIDEIERDIDGLQFTEYRPKSFVVNCGMGFNNSIKDMTCDIKIFDTGLE